MTLVGFDTSTPATSACVLRDDGRAFEVTPEPGRLLEPPGHSRELLPAVAGAMARARVAWPDVDAVAVGVGPGTFTGLRIGIATARALAAARSIPVHPVSSLAAPRPTMSMFSCATIESRGTVGWSVYHSDP